MRSDRYTKVVLTVIAVCLCVLVLPRLDATEVLAESGQSGAAVAIGPQQSTMPPSDNASVTSRAAIGPTSSLPLRWRVSWAAVRTIAITWCSTAVVVTNTTAATVNVEVEWMTSYGGSVALELDQVYPHRQNVWILDGSTSTIGNSPFFWYRRTTSSDFQGYALVNADDPRVMVSAFQYCRSNTTSTGTVVAQTNIPAYPVGTTAQYFQAGMPAAWTPPMAVPEVPESAQ